MRDDDETGKSTQAAENKESTKLTENDDNDASKQNAATEADNQECSTTNSTEATRQDQNVQNGTETSRKTNKESIKLTTSTTTSTKDIDYAKHVNYLDDGSAIYTDPNSNFKYKWSVEQNSWLPCEDSTTTHDAAANPYENEHYKWCKEKQQWLPKTQQTETEHYKWDVERNEWILKDRPTTTSTTNQPSNDTDIAYDIDADGQRVYTDNDGTVFFWDTDKNAWFPKIDDDFMARYQMNYGFIDNTSASEEDRRLRDEQEARRKEEELQRMAEEARAAMAATAAGGVVSAIGNKRKAAQEPPKWFDLDPSQNTKVYVSNLPLDITIDEFAEVMGKCGMIMRDPQTQKYKLKLYTETDGQVKGDGLCDYIKVESVDLALKILDEYDLRGKKIRVQRAKFQMRGEYNPALKPKRKKKDKEKLQKIKDKLFDWRPDKMRGERSKNEKVIILKNLFHPDIFEKEVQLVLDYQNDLREECSKCGVVRKVVLYDRHPEGVAQVNMSTPEEADLVIQMMQGRFFGKRQLTAEHWDGKTKYKTTETDTETQKRLSHWDAYLGNDHDDDNDDTKKDMKSASTKESAIAN